MPNNHLQTNSKPDQTSPAGTEISTQISRQRINPETPTPTLPRSRPPASPEAQRLAANRDRDRQQREWATKFFPRENPTRVVGALSLAPLYFRDRKPSVEELVDFVESRLRRNR